METFQKLDTEIITKYNNKDFSGSLISIKQLLKLAQFDTEVAKQLNENFLRLKHNFSRIPEIKTSKSIGILFGDKQPNFSPDDITGEKPLYAGSEEAVVNLALELSKLDYKVYVLNGNTSYHSLPHANPRYCSKSDIEQVDVMIIYRDCDQKYAREHSKQTILWCHDIYAFFVHPKFVDKCFWLTEFQRQHYIAHQTNLLLIPSVIGGNGINKTHFGKWRKDNIYSCVYASNYVKGLLTLLNIWSQIKSKFPLATLHIYYGRELFLPNKDDLLKTIIDKIEKLKTLSVFECGKVSHFELAQKLSEASILAFPCRYEETYSIVAIKAQAAGCIPVTTRYAALGETVHPNAPTISDFKDDQEYADLLISVMERLKTSDDNTIEEERKIYSDFALEKTWSVAANKMRELIDMNITSNKNEKRSMDQLINGIERLETNDEKV